MLHQPVETMVSIALVILLQLGANPQGQGQAARLPIQHPLAMDNFGFVRGGGPLRGRMAAFLPEPMPYQRLKPLRTNHQRPRFEPFPNLEQQIEEELLNEPEVVDEKRANFELYEEPPRQVQNIVKQERKREEELEELYEKIAKEFPFVAKQGLGNGAAAPSLDDLFAMTIFGQPQRGKRRG